MSTKSVGAPLAATFVLRSSLGLKDPGLNSILAYIKNCTETNSKERLGGFFESSARLDVRND